MAHQFVAVENVTPRQKVSRHFKRVFSLGGCNKISEPFFDKKAKQNNKQQHQRNECGRVKSAKFYRGCSLRQIQNMLQRETSRNASPPQRFSGRLMTGFFMPELFVSNTNTFRAKVPVKRTERDTLTDFRGFFKFATHAACFGGLHVGSLLRLFFSVPSPEKKTKRKMW